MKKFTVFAMAALAASVASASVLDFSYNTTGAEPGYYGTKKKENYDVAIRIDNPALAGKKITGLKVQLPGDASLYTAPSAFLTTELVVERIDGVRVNVPDICSVDATIADGYLTATFAEPYTLTADPVYVGYAIQVAELTEASKMPLAVVPGHDANGFWLHSSRTQLKWADYSGKVDEGMQSAMVISIEGEFPEASAAIALPERQICLTGKENEFSFEVVNGGLSQIDNVGYIWEVADQKGQGVYTFPTPVPGTLGARGTVTITIPAIDMKGASPISVKIVEVNGQENVNESASAEANMIFAPALPVNRPLVEEYTGLWCGWCVRGYAALEYLAEEYGSDFVAAAWHAGDEMCITSAFPSKVSGYPYAYINRDIALDPGQILSVWPEVCKQPVDISIACELKFTDDSKNAVTATATVNSISDTDKSYKLGFILVADGLTDPKWAQSNYYSGSTASAERDLPEKYRDMFVNAGSSVKGLIFNDVALSTEYVMGVPKSLPEELKAFEDNTYSVSFDLSEFRNIFVKPTASNPDANLLTIDKDKVRVLAFIIAPDGTIVNSCKSIYPDGTAPGAVEGIHSDAEVVATAFYDLQGRAVDTKAAKGILVRVCTLSDGTVRVDKIAVK